jgi:hypothetical protein
MAFTRLYERNDGHSSPLRDMACSTTWRQGTKPEGRASIQKPSAARTEGVAPPEVLVDDAPRFESHAHTIGTPAWMG